MSHSFETGNVILDQSSSILLRRGRVAIAQFCSIDKNPIDSLELAMRLQGVSRAITDIVLEQTVVEMRDDVLRHFESPYRRRGRMFMVQPNYSRGVLMSVRAIEHGRIHTVYEGRVPADRQIDKLLMQEPALWDTMVIHARDFRSGRRVTAHPFSNRHYEPGAPNQYLGLLQELSAELLAVTEGQ